MFQTFSLALELNNTLALSLACLHTVTITFKPPEHNQSLISKQLEQKTIRQFLLFHPFLSFFFFFISPKNVPQLILLGDSGSGDDCDISSGFKSLESLDERLFENDRLTNKELNKEGTPHHHSSSGLMSYKLSSALLLFF